MIQEAYQLTKPLLFKTDAERAHDMVMAGLSFSANRPGLLRLLASECRLQDPKLEQTLKGVRFPNPMGLAAGMDKNARAIRSWQALGFGSVEVGSITAHPQEGNPKPRLFRLLEDKALINRFGFNNDGAVAVAERLKRSATGIAIPLGINIGKSKITPNEKAAEDYLFSVAQLQSHADYLVVNVSSPNTQGLRDLQGKEQLEHLLSTLQGQRETSKPLFLKIAPDMEWQAFDEVVEVAMRQGIDGLIISNTTVSRAGLKTSIDEAGGLSGEPLKAHSLECLRYVRQHLSQDMVLVSVGGVSSFEDVLERLRAGASLIQIYTAFIYQGPKLIYRINQKLLAHMEREGMQSVSELVG